MSYIIRIQIGKEYRYFIRSANDVLTLGTKPRGATRFQSKEEAKRIADVALGGMAYDITEIE